MHSATVYRQCLGLTTSNSSLKSISKSHWSWLMIFLFDLGSIHCFLMGHQGLFNVPIGTDVLGDLKSVLEGLVTRARRQ